MQAYQGHLVPKVRGAGASPFSRISAGMGSVEQQEYGSHRGDTQVRLRKELRAEIQQAANVSGVRGEKSKRAEPGKPAQAPGQAEGSHLN